MPHNPHGLWLPVRVDFFECPLLRPVRIGKATDVLCYLRLAMLAKQYGQGGVLPRAFCGASFLADMIGGYADLTECEVGNAVGRLASNGLITVAERGITIAHFDALFSTDPTRSERQERWRARQLAKTTAQNQNVTVAERSHNGDQSQSQSKIQSKRSPPRKRGGGSAVVDDRIEHYRRAVRAETGQEPPHDPAWRSLFGRLLRRGPPDVAGADWPVMLDRVVLAYIGDDGRAGWLRREAWPLAYLAKHLAVYLARARDRGGGAARPVAADPGIDAMVAGRTA